MKIYQVDAFARQLFQGNPAAVMPLSEWLPDALMQNIAMENNLAETAFLVPSGKGYEIRWFTPTVEVDLCGHATLASGHVLFEHMGFAREAIVFYSRRSGELRVTRNREETGKGFTPRHGGRGGSAAAQNMLTLDFPVNDPAPVEPLSAVFEGLRIAPRALYKGAYDYMVVLDSQRELEGLNPDFKILATVPGRGVVVTARGDSAERGNAEPRSDDAGLVPDFPPDFPPDFVSRCFYPQSGIDEDPVTGSAHTMMVPYWAAVLGKTRMSAIQLSRRRGYLDCRLEGSRVLMSGYAKTFLVGEITGLR